MKSAAPRDYAMHSDRLRFEALTADHAAELHEALTDPRVLEYIGGVSQSLDEMRDAFVRRAAGPPANRPDVRWTNFVVRLRADGTAIGLIEAAWYPGYGEIGYQLGAKWWNAGYATESIVWLQRQLAQVAPSRDWYASVHPANEWSVRLLARLGYLPVPAGTHPTLGSYDSGDLCFVLRA
jgi:RimJ/RimL family protein N-acetyltransferase